LRIHFIPKKREDQCEKEIIEFHKTKIYIYSVRQKRFTKRKPVFTKLKICQAVTFN